MTAYTMIHQDTPSNFNIYCYQRLVLGDRSIAAITFGYVYMNYISSHLVFLIVSAAVLPYLTGYDSQSSCEQVPVYLMPVPAAAAKQSLLYVFPSSPHTGSYCCVQIRPGTETRFRCKEEFSCRRSHTVHYYLILIELGTRQFLASRQCKRASVTHKKYEKC